MDPKLREKTKAVFHTILKNCEAQKKAESTEDEYSDSNTRNYSRRLNLPKHTRRS